MSADDTTIEFTGTAMLIPKDAANHITGLLVLLERRETPGSYELTCFGPKRHYRKDGSCRCVAATLALMTNESRANTTLNPWGGKPR